VARAAQQIVLGSGRAISKTLLFWALHSGGWLALGVVIFAWRMSMRGPLLAGNDVILWLAGGVALTLGFRSLYRWVRASSLVYPAVGAIALLLSGGGAFIWQSLYVGLLRLDAWLWSSGYFGNADLGAKLAAIAMQPWVTSVRPWMTSSCLLLTWTALYFGINAIVDLEVERGRGARALQLAHRAQLSSLQTQLNPHFLFNALNGIATLIRTNECAAAAAMVDDLGDFLRIILQKLDSPQISVYEELALVNQYLHIQARRFGDRLRTHVAADPDVLGASLPTLILQPLVENALRHGVLMLEEGGAVNVAVRKRDATLVVSVDNDGPAIHENRPAGLGLRNCADRLSALYGDAVLMRIGPGPAGRGFAVLIELPFCQEPQLRLGARTA
jgi:two-component system, LytTR family, sensor kinase